MTGRRAGRLWDRTDYGDLPSRLHVTNNWAVSPVALGALKTEDHKVAIFGSPGSGRCQCVI